MRVSATPAYFIEQAITEYRDAPQETGNGAGSPTHVAKFVIRWLDQNGYSLRENDAPTMTEHRALLDALVARGLRWNDGELHDAPEPADRYVVFDGEHDVWQRDDFAAGGGERRWWSAGDSGAATWTELRARGPVTPPGGIAPPTRQENKK